MGGPDIDGVESGCDDILDYFEESVGGNPILRGFFIRLPVTRPTIFMARPMKLLVGKLMVGM